MKILLNPIFIIVLLFSGWVSIQASPEDMYAKIQASVQSICRDYSYPRFTLVISSDDQVKSQQTGFIHITKLNETIARKEQAIAQLEAQISRLRQEVLRAEQVLGAAYEHLNAAARSLQTLQNASDEQVVRAFLVPTKD